MTIQNLFDDFLRRHRRKNNSESTIKTDKQRFAFYLRPFYNELNLTDLEIEHHQILFDDMEANEKSPQLRDKVRTLLHAMFENAVTKQAYDGAFPFNPIKAIEKPTIDHKDIQWLNPSQVIQFLEAHKESPYYPLYFTGFYTGLRIGELCGMDWEQVDLTHNILTVDRQYNELTRKITPPKGRKIRHLGLIPEVVEVLDPLQGTGFVFRKLTGRNFLNSMLQPNYFRGEILPGDCKKAEVKKINPHGLRHSFAALWLIQGGRMETLQKLLGHASIKTTESYYGHLDFSHIKNQMGIISKMGNVTHVDFESVGGLRGGPQ